MSEVDLGIMKVKVWVLVLLILGAGVAYGHYAGLIVFPWEKPGIVREPYYGSVSLYVYSTNSLTGADLDGTSEAYTAYGFAQGYKIGGIALTADSSTTISLNKEDQGKLWVKIYAGSTVYLDVARLKTLSNVEKVELADVNGDDEDEIYVLLNLAEVGRPGQASTPTWTFAVPLFTEETSLATSADDHAGEAATSHAVTITWTVTGMAADSVCYFNKLYFVTNNQSFEGDLITFQNLKVIAPNGETLLNRNYIDEYSTTYYGAIYLGNEGGWDSSYTKGIPIVRRTNDADITYIKLTVLYDGTVGGGVDVTGYLKIVDSDNDVTSLTLTASLVDD